MTPTDSLGLNLNDPEVYGTISRIYWSRIAPQAMAGGLDEEDVFQALLERLLRSNGGSAPYDPAKSSISNYSYISMTSGLRNLIDSKKRATRRGWQTGEEDVATWDAACVEAQEGEVWRRAVLEAVAEGQEPITAALGSMTDSVGALLIGWELVAIQVEREDSQRKPRRRSRRPRKRPRSRQEARRRVPRSLGPWELVGLREAALGA